MTLWAINEDGERKQCCLGLLSLCLERRVTYHCLTGGKEEGTWLLSRHLVVFTQSSFWFPSMYSHPSSPAHASIILTQSWATYTPGPCSAHTLGSSSQIFFRSGWAGDITQEVFVHEAYTIWETVFKKGNTKL